MSTGGKQHKSLTQSPVSPLDFTNTPLRFPFPGSDDKGPSAEARSRTSSNSSSTLSLKPPRTPRFAEATAVNSPIEPSDTGRSPFADPPGAMAQAQPKPSDVGLGYIGDADSIRHATTPSAENGPKSPLKSAMRAPGTPGRTTLNPLSPTFREEQVLEKYEGTTEKENARDLKVKTRVRIAKIFLRGTNFSCSLIVLSMLSATFSIFNATKTLPPRNNLPVWAQGTSTWPQITVLVISCVSLFLCIIIMWNHCKGKRRRAQKTDVYYTVFLVAFFFFGTVMWAFGAGVLHVSRANGNGQDMWGWSCKENKRSQLFEQDVHYALVCRLQNWSLVCCLIEVVVETITIAIYSMVFYRYWSKKRLRKSMDTRDKARSDLYLAQLRSQSAPNTPGFGPMSPRLPSDSKDPLSRAEEGEGTQFARATPSFNQPRPFQLQAPPIRIQNATPRPAQEGFEQAPAPATHVPAAPGEKTYDAVPIPGAYGSPLSSPSFPPPAQSAFAPPGQAYTTEHRIESPPSSPRPSQTLRR